MSRKGFRNRKKKQALEAFDLPSLDHEDDKLATKCKFNFCYLDESQAAGQKISDLSQNDLIRILTALRDLSKQSMDEWKQDRNYANYAHFPPPKKTDFKRPKTIPHQAVWGRFRLGSLFRLAGFVIPSEYAGQKHPITKKPYDTNTFYVVFIDKNHKFWKPDRS